MNTDEKTLKAIAQRLRRWSLLTTSEAGSGHPTTCLSAAEIMSALFFREMNFDPGNPYDPEMDAFVLSKGHAAPILYAALKEAGCIEDDPMTLRLFTSRLEGHPMPGPGRFPWVRVATGSLGQGLSCGAGMAIARKIDGRKSRVYVLLGDGECAEGSVWEAAEFAAYNDLDNLCAVLDANALGQSGPTMHGHDMEEHQIRWKAFGWNAQVVDGHDVGQITAALDAARKVSGKPSIVLARTDKGHGVSFLSGKEGWHGKPLKKGAELDAALKEVGGEQPVALPARERRGRESKRPVPRAPSRRLETSYKLGQEVATREAYGAALVKLGDLSEDVVVLDAEVKNSTFAEKFKGAHASRYVECYIAEQNMIGVGLGLAVEGKLPFASSFACFLSRAYDQMRMGGLSQPPALVVCGSHAGVSIGEDGPSQMALEDIAMMRAVVGSTVLYPCDGVSAEKLVEAAALRGGIVYIRSSRPKTKVIYGNEEEFPVGGSKVVRSSAKDRATIVGAGVTLHEALEAADALAKDGIAVRVVDLYSVKPLDEKTLQTAARETGRLFVVEDHYAMGGIGEAVAAAVSGLAPVRALCVREAPRSGQPKELMRVYGIDAASIAQAVRASLG